MCLDIVLAEVLQKVTAYTSFVRLGITPFAIPITDSEGLLTIGIKVCACAMVANHLRACWVLDPI